MPALDAHRIFLSTVTAEFARYRTELAARFERVSVKAQARLLDTAVSPREFAKLLIETESRLLGETVNWYARRSFVGVA